MPADEITSKGIPFHMALSPPPRNVGTPDSAETPAPVNTKLRLAVTNRWRRSSETDGFVTVCIAERGMVTERGGKMSRKVNFGWWFNLGTNEKALVKDGAVLP